MDSEVRLVFEVASVSPQPQAPNPSIARIISTMTESEITDSDSATCTDTSASIPMQPNAPCPPLPELLLLLMERLAAEERQRTLLKVMLCNHECHELGLPLLARAVVADGWFAPHAETAIGKGLPRHARKLVVKAYSGWESTLQVILDAYLGNVGVLELDFGGMAIDAALVVKRAVEDLSSSSLKTVIVNASAKFLAERLGTIQLPGSIEKIVIHERGPPAQAAALIPWLEASAASAAPNWTWSLETSYEPIMCLEQFPEALQRLRGAFCGDQVSLSSLSQLSRPSSTSPFLTLTRLTSYLPFDAEIETWRLIATMDSLETVELIGVPTRTLFALSNYPSNLQILILNSPRPSLNPDGLELARTAVRAIAPRRVVFDARDQSAVLLWAPEAAREEKRGWREVENVVWFG